MVVAKFSKLVRIVYFNDNPQSPPPPASPPPPPPANDKTFTQADVDRIVAERVKKAKESNAQLISELEEFKKSKGLTQEQLDNLTSRIESLQREGLSKEELHKADMEKMAKKAKKELDELSGDREAWKGRYTKLLIDSQVTKAAIDHKAASIRQILDMLVPKIKLVPSIGADGKPTGEMEAKVSIQAMKDDQEITLEDLSIDTAIKTMRDTPQLYGNLFTVDGKPGLGLGNQGTGGAGGKDPSKMTEEEYYAWRERRKKEQGY